ncbi:hypothetical protein [Changchengzhania lutea]|uniref:hypothetical protein n=1 Tax=Changchengzhania lutea TaxID=2049305 RepID=UPI00115DB17B|nr:hypothetical protein [Changchengzhania lutea]
MNEITTKEIPIKDLILWDENARFPDKYYNSEEKDLINYFISKPEYKIKKFAKEIVSQFNLPQLEKLVVWNDEGNFIVLEGNRRLTVYKLLSNPELIENHGIKTYIKELKSKININEYYSLECLVTNNKELGLEYIDRKHAKGNNEVNWQEPERTNYNLRRGNGTINDTIVSGVSNIVKDLDLPERMKEDILGKGYVTTFYRAITTTPAKKKYKYKITENGELKIENENFKDELKVVIYQLLNKSDFEGNKINSRTLNKKENIESFIQKINPKDVKKVETEIEKSTTENLFGGKTINIGKNNIKVANDKIPSKNTPTGLFFREDVPFRIDSSSLKILYDELKNIPVKVYPNATHDLLRSFLECSLAFYFKKSNHYNKISKSKEHNPKLGEMLTYIINKKCNELNDSNVISTIKSIKTDYEKPYSLERMHMINHNENFVSVEKDVRAAWSKLEPLFKIILVDK